MESISHVPSEHILIHSNGITAPIWLPQEIGGAILRFFERPDAYRFLLTCKAAASLRKYVWSKEARQFGYTKDNPHRYLSRFYSAIKGFSLYSNFPPNLFMMHTVKFKKGKRSKRCIDLYQTALALQNATTQDAQLFISSLRYCQPHIHLVMRQLPRSSAMEAINTPIWRDNLLVPAVRNAKALACLLNWGAATHVAQEELSPMHRAATLGCVKSIRLLAWAKADPNVVWREVVIHHHTHSSPTGSRTSTTRSYHYHTPLELAIRYNHPKAVKALLAAQANPHMASLPTNPPPFKQALAKGHVNLLEAFLDHLSNRQIDESLIKAAKMANAPCVQILLERGANPNQTVGEYSLLYYAVRKGHVSIVRLLAEHGGDISAIAPSGMSPLFLVVSKKNVVNRINMACCLMECGASPKEVGPKGETVMEYVKRKKKKKFYRILVDTTVY